MRRLLSLSALVPFVVLGCYEEPPATSPGPNAVAVAAPEPLLVAAPPGSDVTGAAAPPPAAPVPAPAPMSAGAQALAFAFQAPTPQPAAPPPLAHPAMLALPALPPLGRYRPPRAAPKEKVVTECGATWNGVDWTPRECLDDDGDSGHGRPARVVIPYALMPSTAVALPPVVDHRLEGMEGPMRHQVGDECSAFAFTAGLDHAYSFWSGKPGAFSVTQVWGRYHTTFEARAIEGNIGDPIAAEAELPYDHNVVMPWRACPRPPHKPAKPGTCEQPVDPALLAHLASVSVGVVTQVEVIPRGRTDIIRQRLAAGDDVVFGISLHSFATGGDPGSQYIVPDEAGKSKKGAHSHTILIVGYAMTPNGTYFLLHNSHGEKWGDGGYGWIHEDLVKEYSINADMVVVDMQPNEVARRRLRADGSLAAKCAPGMLRDSISGECAGACADGSPRHNNVCPASPNDCQAGAVNLTGSCVMGAPRTSGIDPSSRIRWVCGAAGCSYDIPQGELGCRQGMCEASCPAPVYRLATMPSGLACVE